MAWDDALRQAEKMRRIDDWHHKMCDISECQQSVCLTHHRVYWVCQDAVYEPETNYYGGNGECIYCKKRDQDTN